MDPVFTLISPSPDIVFPHGWVGWLGFFGLSAVTLILLWKFRTYNLPRTPHRLTFFFLLLALTLFTSLFIGIQMEFGDASAVSTGFIEPPAPTVMFFSTIPWVIAAGLLGPLAAAALAFVGGFFTSLFQTHSIFTPLELSLLAIIFSFAVRQKYRTTSYQLLRHPLAAAALHGNYFPNNSLFCTDVYLRRQPGHPPGLFPAELDGDIDCSRNRVDDRWLAG